MSNKGWEIAHPYLRNPVANVKFVPIEQVEPNDYNPNSVAPNEMRLLYVSIKADGYTQPVVTIHDAERDRYVIVDGFHRYTVMRTHPDIYEANDGMLPVVVIDKPINERMASTVRHNRARGKHALDGMADMVFAMLEEGWKDEDVCNEIGVTPEELGRLKHVTGFSKLFENAEYRRAWTTRRMAQFKRDYEKGETLPTEETDDSPADEA